MSTLRILTLNNISPRGLARLPADRYAVSSDEKQPDAILVRSHKMHDMELPPSLRAVARAGAGTNNIPVDRLSKLGIPVFNTPGANANAVKELVLAGMLIACRKLCDAWDFARRLEGTDVEISRAVEAGKKQFAGIELPGRTIGVIGLGAIGRSVANMCLELGMNAIGYDPNLTVEGAWQLAREVRRATSVEQVLREAEFVSMHVPLTPQTRHMINADNLAQARAGSTVLNFAREGIVDDAAVCDAVDRGQLNAYVSDFPSNRTRACRGAITLPHLGASTAEAEENCAVMAAEQLRDFLENGNLRNSVNFPEVRMARGTEHRLVVANANVPNMLGQISTAMAQANLNIHDMINQSRGELAYTIVDTDAPLPESLVRQVRTIPGVMMARVI
jgi:D-3-phosphoglycerate dehydrogenase